MRSDPIYLRALMYFMITATVALSIAITIAKLDPNEFRGDFYWSRSDHQLDESLVSEHDGFIEVAYNQNNQPYFRALFNPDEECAFQLGVDMDQNGIVDFTILDGDGDGSLDFDLIFCHENCDEAMRRARLLFDGKLTLEKTI